MSTFSVPHNVYGKLVAVEVEADSVAEAIGQASTNLVHPAAVVPISTAQVSVVTAKPPAKHSTAPTPKA